MLRTLIKKQFKELFSFYFFNKKTGKNRSGGQIAGAVILTIFVVLILFGSFGALASFFAMSFVPVGLDWLYFALIGLIAVFLGSIIDMLTAKNVLYDAKDNELLLSLPIKPSAILFSRMLVLFIWGAIYTAIIFWPAIAVYFIFASFSVRAIICALLTFLVSCFAVLILSCLFGWIVAIIAAKLKNKSILSVLLAVILIGVYYVCYFKMNTLMTSAVENADKLSRAIHSYLFPFYHMGQGASGNILSFLIYFFITAVMFAIVYYILTKRFISIVTTNRGTRIKEKTHSSKKSSMRSALVKRELVHFSQSPAYMLNIGLGLIIMPVAGIAAVIKADALRTALSSLAEITGRAGLLSLIVPVAVMFGSSMTCVSAPSISLEGKSIWIIRTLPVSAKNVFDAKLLAHLILVLPSTLAFCILCIIALELPPLQAILGLFLSLIFTALCAVLGLYANIKHPRFEWPNETVVVKQSAAVSIALFGGWLIAIIFAAAGFLMLKIISAELFLLLFIIIILAATVLINRWVYHKGAQRYEEFG